MIDHHPSSSSDPKTVENDLRTLTRFIEVYCGDCHEAWKRRVVTLKSHDVAALMGREISLCPDCTKLLCHALVKRSNCPMDPKPQCKHCPNHCYHPTYRKKIQEVMMHSGRKLVMRGRFDYLLHLLF